MNPSSTIVVIPCYDEAARLDVERFAEFARRAAGVHLLFVDDGSSDGTLEQLHHLQAGCPEKIDVLSLPANRGKAEAVRRGFLRAFDRNPRYVGFWDADLATPLEDVLAFRDLMDERQPLEMVFGARVQLLGRSIRRQALRHYLGRVFATAVSLVLDLQVYDTQCGAKLFRVSPKLQALFAAPFVSRWIFDVEIIARLIIAHREPGLPPVEQVIYEYPLQQWRDVRGSKLTCAAYLKTIADLVAIHRTLERSRRSTR